MAMLGGECSECCGGWYCISGECASCASGNYPAAINTLVTMAVNDGSVQFPARLVLYSTADQGIGACAAYAFSVGGNPNAIGYSNQPLPVIQFTFQDIGPAVWASFEVYMSLSLVFGGACFRALGNSTITANQFSLTASDLRSTRGGGFLWNLASNTYVGSPTVSSSSPLCYADWAGVPPVAISGGTFAKQYGGTLSISLVSVE